MSRGNMKTTAAALALCALAALALPAGCGENSRARRMLEKGLQTYNQAVSDPSLQNMEEELLDSLRSGAGLTQPQVNQYKELCGDFKKEMAEAKKRFKEVSSGCGGDYRKYARLMMSAIDTMVETVDRKVERFQYITSSGGVDEGTRRSAVEAMSRKIDELGKKYARTFEQAQELLEKGIR